MQNDIPQLAPELLVLVVLGLHVCSQSGSIFHHTLQLVQDTS